MDYYDHDERERKQMYHSSGPVRIYRAGLDESEDTVDAAAKAAAEAAVEAAAEAAEEAAAEAAAGMAAQMVEGSTSRRDY